MSRTVKQQAARGGDALENRYEPVEHRLEINGVELCFFEWHASRAGLLPTILLAHATGFHARIWDEVVAEMGDDRHVISVDQRGHGRSSGEPIEDWADFGADLIELIRRLELGPIIGVGHSMGGHAMVEAAARLPDRFERLVLIDPVIGSPESDGSAPSHLPDGEMHPTVKRRRRFDSPKAMFDRFADRRPYSLFRPEVLRDYCEYGLLPSDDGDSFDLACSPEVEASVYMTSRTNPAIHDLVAHVAVPVLILRAPPSDHRDMMDFSASPTWPALVGRFPNAKEHLLSDLTHFIPMQEPALAARAILEGQLS